ncbi:hypothetical protein JCM3774_002467 [Rhodotorula dairenensis]
MSSFSESGSGETPASGGASSRRATPLFLPADTPRSPSPSTSDQQVSSQRTSMSRAQGSSASSEWLLPRTGSHRRSVYDTVISHFPDVSPPFLLQRMNEHHDDATLVIEELFPGGYPLAQGGVQIKLEPSAYDPAKDDDEQARFKHHVECQCCLESIPLAQVGHCSDGHAFCASCLTKRASDAIASKKPELACFAIGTACTASFAPIELKRAVPHKLLDKLDDLQLQVELDRAGLAGLEKCPFCPFAAVIDEGDIHFPCQGCKIVSCRRCRQEEHGARPCPVLPRTEAEVLHQIEEAMSEAIIRRCPSCGVACTKTEGCNKMTCGPCGAHFCYVCGERTERSAHWNESVKGDTRCPANDDSEQRNFLEATRKRKIAELEDHGIVVPEQAKSSDFGPARPKKRTRLEKEALYRNGRHVFRSQDSSFEQRPDRDLQQQQQKQHGHLPSGYQPPFMPASGGWPVALPPAGPAYVPRPPPWSTFDTLGMVPPLPSYGYAAAGSGLFGGGASGGGATGCGSWRGRKGAAESEVKAPAPAAGTAESAYESEPPTPPPEPEEVRRQRTLEAVLKRQQGASQSRTVE